MMQPQNDTRLNDRVPCVVLVRVVVCAYELLVEMVRPERGLKVADHDC